MNIRVYSKESLSSAIGELRKYFKEKKYFFIKLTPGKIRTLPQNAIQHVWYDQVSKEEGEYTPEEVKSFCKYHCGLPIVRADDEKYNLLCCDIIDPLPYESKIKAMRYLPCTSMMNTEQLNRYLEHVQSHYIGRVNLEFMEDE